ncbi:MAG: aconitase X catalytic domain-containing protein [Gammaproteobacteria bacterium]|nr:aconitase X catalytic domain-containing protein [Gammaproteobacteria bacterium]
MKLNELEQTMLAGALGEPRRHAIRQQIEVGRFFDAVDFVEVSHVHLMADTESLGASGVVYLEELADYPEEQRRVRVPTITDPRGIDLCRYRRIKQKDAWAELEQRAIDAFQRLGILMTNTCINYQIVQAPVFGEHLAFGDTGSVIYANSVCGARSNFEGGPAALTAALTGRVPRYGYHLDACRRGTHLFEIKFVPEDQADWGALGAVVGQHAGSYWTVPVLTGIHATPTSDQLKHFGAALASYGSVPLFHIEGVTPEAADLGSVFDRNPPAAQSITAADIEAFYASLGRHRDEVDVVVMAAPQLSLLEMQRVAQLINGRQVHAGTDFVIATAPEIKGACDRLGITQTLENAGVIVLEGVCFYQMYARETGEANGWRKLVSNSAKLVNIIQGYGYEPVLATTECCIDAAVNGKMGG